MPLGKYKTGQGVEVWCSEILGLDKRGKFNKRVKKDKDKWGKREMRS